MPNVLSLVSCFLPNEMLHVYRQVSNLQNFNSTVVTRRRDNIALFPFNNLYLLRKSKIRLLYRAYCQMVGSLVPLSNFEVSQILSLSRRLENPLLHIYQGDIALRSIKLLKKFPGPRIISFHGADLSNSYTECQYRKLWSLVEVVLCRCKAFYPILEKLGCPNEKIRLNYTGIPIPTKHIDMNFSCCGKDKPLKILQVSRFIEKKGLDITIKAFKKILDLGFNAKLVLVGDGPLKPKLIKMTINLELKSKVEFKGFLNQVEIKSEYLDADLFCHPSRETEYGDREGIPNSILEAMSYGVPVISTSHSGIPEVISDLKTGILIEKDNYDFLANAFIKLLNDKTLCQEIAKNSRDLVKSKFSIKECVRSLEESYNSAFCLREL